MTPRGRKLALLWGIVLAAVGAAFVVEPIPQDPGYHDFADRRIMAGIPNALDVLSNLPFLVVGILGLLRARALGPGRGAWTVVFLGVLGTAFGSAWYHLDPENETLVWDRLPMTLGFMGLVGVVVGEQVSRRAGRVLLPPLLAAGIASVAWWHVTESEGRGDLRWYALVQFLPLLVLPLVALMFRKRLRGLSALALALGFYVLAKVLEALDCEIYGTLRMVSGHTLKHLAAGAATWCLYLALRARIEDPPALRGSTDPPDPGPAAASASASG